MRGSYGGEEGELKEERMYGTVALRRLDGLRDGGQELDVVQQELGLAVVQLVLGLRRHDSAPSDNIQYTAR